MDLQADVALENLDSSTNVATLKSLMTKLGKSPRFVGSLGASEYAYSLQARQLIPFEIGSQKGGALYRDALEKLKAKTGLTDEELVAGMVLPGFALGLQNAAQAAGLPILVRSAETGIGSYLATMSPQITLEVSGPRWATKLFNESIGRALEQTDANLIRNPTLGEISAGAPLTTVVQVRIGEDATDAQIKEFMEAVGKIPDSNGATAGDFLGGHTSIRDADGERVVAMHGGFYGGNFLLEVRNRLEDIRAAAQRIFGPEAQVDTTKRIVETYGHDPSHKYQRTRKTDRRTTPGGSEQDRSRGETLETIGIGRQAESGIRAFILRRLAAAASKRKGAVSTGKDAQDVLGEFVSHIENYFAFRSKRSSQLAPETKQAVGISNPKEALVALSARAIAEGLENPKVLGLASLLWDLAQRVQRGGIADVQIHKGMTSQEMRDVNTALLERVAFKSEREVGKRRAKIEDDMRKEGRKKALEQEVEDDKLREAAAAPAPEGETAPQKDKRVKGFERRIAAALKAKEKREKELEKDIAAALKAVLPGKGVILKGGGKYSVPTGFAALPLEVGSVLLVNKRRAEYDHGENWREAAVEAQKKKTAIKVYLETLAPVAGAYGYAVTTTLDGQVSRAEVISDEVGRRLIGELEAEEESLAETPSEPSDIKMSKSIDELGVDESTQNVQGANRDGTYSTEKSQGDQRRGDRGGRSDSRRAEALPGAPRIQKASGPDPRLNRVAERYARSIGLNLARQSHYAEVDEDLAKSIADAYEQMPHAPRDPVVAEAYANLIRQTTDQYRALEEDGYQFWFVDPDNHSGYLDSPYNAMRDIRANKSMGVYPTSAGFGSGATDIDVSKSPLLADTGIEWPYGSLDGPLKAVTANDLFRAVHDAFLIGICFFRGTLDGGSESGREGVWGERGAGKG